jgi:valyl-tRNA synthetase
LALSVLQRLLAPFVPFVTEEVWRWWHASSVHLAPWPTVGELTLDGDAVEPGSVYVPVCDVLEAVRRAKSRAKVSQRAEVSLCRVSGSATLLEAVRQGRRDLDAAGTILEMELHESADVVIEVTLSQA